MGRTTSSSPRERPTRGWRSWCSRWGGRRGHLDAGGGRERELERDRVRQAAPQRGPRRWGLRPGAAEGRELPQGAGGPLAEHAQPSAPAPDGEGPPAAAPAAALDHRSHEVVVAGGRDLGLDHLARVDEGWLTRRVAPEGNLVEVGDPVDLGRLLGVAPQSRCSDSSLAPSTRTSTLRPTKARWCSAAMARWTSMTVSKRSRFTASGTWSAMAAAGVPSSLEYSKTPSRSKRCSLDEGLELVEVGLGLAGQADDEVVRRTSPGTRARSLPQERARKADVAAPLHERGAACPGCAGAACRGTSRSCGSVRHDLDELVGKVARVGVVQPDPPHASTSRHRARAARGAWAGRVGRSPVGGEVLGDRGSARPRLPAASALRLGHDVGDGAAALPAAELGDDAEGAGVVAALADLEERLVAGSELMRGVRRS